MGNTRFRGGQAPAESSVGALQVSVGAILVLKLLTVDAQVLPGQPCIGTTAGRSRARLDGGGHLYLARLQKGPKLRCAALQFSHQNAMRCMKHLHLQKWIQFWRNDSMPVGGPIA
jgi:hypothetical protein